MSDSVWPHRRQPTRLPRPWDSPGKNTGVGCHFLLQCMKVESESEVAQFSPTLSDPMDCNPPGSSIHGIFQAGVLEWGAIAFSAGFFCRRVTPELPDSLGSFPQKVESCEWQSDGFLSLPSYFLWQTKFACLIASWGLLLRRPNKLLTDAPLPFPFPSDYLEDSTCSQSPSGCA